MWTVTKLGVLTFAVTFLSCLLGKLALWGLEVTEDKDNDVQVHCKGRQLLGNLLQFSVRIARVHAVCQVGDRVNEHSLTPYASS